MKSAQKNRVTGKKGGIVKLLLIVIAVILILSYFGINLRQLVSAPTTQDNISYVATTSVSVWHKYLKAPVSYAWNKVFVNLIWNPALENMKKD